MTTITADFSLISRVPVLESNGSNWLIFSTRFKYFVRSKALWGHFDGTTPKPMPPAAQAEIDAWQKHEDESRNHLAQKLEDTTFLQADEYDTVAEMWEWISNEFTALSAHAVAAMQAEFDSCNCGEHGNVRTHLELLKMKHKGLVAVGVALSDSQYATRIINSLPRYYQRYLSTITSSVKAALIATNIARTVAAAAQASGTTPAPGLTIASGNSASTQAITLAPTYLMHLAVEEWDRIEAEKKRNTPSKSREDTGVALSAQSSASSSLSQSHRSRSGESSGNGNGNGNRRSMPICWNCGGKGHVKSQCPSPKLKGSDTGGKQDASERADAVEDFDEEGAFSVEHVECVDMTHFAGLLCVAAGTALDTGDICDDGEDVLAASPTSVSFNSDVDSRVGEFCGNVLPDIWPELPDASGFSLDFVLERNHAPLSLDCPESDYDWDDTMPDLSEVEVSDDEGDPDVYGYPCALHEGNEIADAVISPEGGQFYPVSDGIEGEYVAALDLQNALPMSAEPQNSAVNPASNTLQFNARTLDPGNFAFHFSDYPSHPAILLPALSLAPKNESAAALPLAPDIADQPMPVAEHGRWICSVKHGIAGIPCHVKIRRVGQGWPKCIQDNVDGSKEERVAPITTTASDIDAGCDTSLLSLSNSSILDTSTSALVFDNNPTGAPTKLLHFPMRTKHIDIHDHFGAELALMSA